MDFTLSEDQEMLRRVARDFLAKECPKTLVREMEESERGYSPELWHKMAELGWMGLVFPEKYGGSEGSFLDLVVLLEEMGRACLPSPFFSTIILGGLPILDIGTEEQKQKFLPQIANGNIILTLALTEPSASYDLNSISCQAVPTGKEYLISGTKLFVPDAHIADYLIGVARAKNGKGDIALFLIDAKTQGISFTLLKTRAGDKQCEVNLDKVKVPQQDLIGKVEQGSSEVKKILERAAVAKCAEMVGGAQQVLEMTIDYAKERKQFDRPIGSFQVIQHYCSNMAMDVDGARFLNYQAAWMLSEGLPCSKEVAMAKAYVSEAYRRVAALGHQIHGAIAFTKDHDLELYIRRTKAAELAFGDADFHHEIIAHELGL